MVYSIFYSFKNFNNITFYKIQSSIVSSQLILSFRFEDIPLWNKSRSKMLRAVKATNNLKIKFMTLFCFVFETILVYIKVSLTRKNDILYWKTEILWMVFLNWLLIILKASKSLPGVILRVSVIGSKKRLIRRTFSIMST